MRQHDWVKTPMIKTDLKAAEKLNERFDECKHCKCVRIRLKGIDPGYELNGVTYDDEPQCVETSN